MRIYEGSPRQDWEEVLRSIGAFVDYHGMKELLLLELTDGFLLQGLGAAGGGAWSETATLQKQTHELDDERIGQLIDAQAEHRSGAGSRHPAVDRTNYYEQALRVLGQYLDGQRPHDIFLFEQDGSFVVRLLGTGGAASAGHVLAEFTREDILAMIDAAPEHRRSAAPAEPGGA